MRARGKEIYIITAVVAVVLIVAWYFLLFSPTQRKLSDLDTQVQSAQSALDMANQEVVKLESYKKTAPQSKAEIVRLGKMLPESEGIPGLIIELTKTAEASGVGITSIARGTTTPGSPFGIQTLTIQVSGRFFDVEDFLYRLEEYVAFRNASFRVTGRLLQVTQLTMQAATSTETATSGSPPLAVTIGLNAYLWGGAGATGDCCGGRCAMNRRMLTYVVIALIVGAALALAVAVASTRSDATGAPNVVTEAGVAGLSSDAGTEALAAADPAREQPLLDKFTSKDPFIPFPTAGGGTASPDAESNEHVAAVQQPVGQDQGGRDVVQRRARATRCPAGRPPSSPSPASRPAT